MIANPGRPSADTQDLFAQIVASLTSGVIAVDKNGTVVTVNAAACSHLHIPRGVLVPGVSFESVPELQQFSVILQEMKVTQQSISRRELEVVSPEGKKIIGMTASLLQGPADFNGVTFLFIDLTEVRQLRRAAEINRQLAQIGEITAGVVHELRNPLSVISGMAELLMRKLGEGNEHQKKARIIFDEAAQLERLIAQFLSFARPYHVEAVQNSAEEIVNRALRLIERLREARNVQIKVEYRADVPAFEADQMQMALALANILRNAVEIVPPGEGRISFIVDRSPEHLHFRCEDNGPGIHLDEGEELFTAFLTKKEGGTGLGLAIVHRIISAHHGTVTYGNCDHAGAWFEIQIPIRQP